MNPFEKYRLTSPFGMRMHPVDHVKRFHRGVDLVISPSNGAIKSFVSGEVLHSKMGVTGSGFGNMGNVVAIKDDKGYLHVYAHLSSIAVKVGQKVCKGQVVGNQGNTGKSTGAHLHYEVRKKCSPSFGWTETESGVVEPTKYLQDYYVITKPDTKPTSKGIITRVLFNGKEMNKGIVVVGVSYMLLTDVGDMFGAGIRFDNSTKKSYIDGKEISGAKLIENRSYVPMREVAESFGAKVSGDGNKGLVSISR